VIFDRIIACIAGSDVRALGEWTTRNWDGPLKRIIPWVTNEFTETIIRESRTALGDDFWGFLMLGGMAGGGMAFFVAPERHDEFQVRIAAIMRQAKSALDDALPFAMEPVVYNFRINPHGTIASLDSGQGAMMPSPYYTLQVPRMLSTPTDSLPRAGADVDHFANVRPGVAISSLFLTMIQPPLPGTRSAADTRPRPGTRRLASENGFDPVQHEQLREHLGWIDWARKAGRRSDWRTPADPAATLAAWRITGRVGHHTRRGCDRDAAAGVGSR
jgi:hypothetical protein